jgi:hypothetical protein
VARAPLRITLTHAHIKDTVTFDVRRIRFRNKELYALVNFVLYQLLLLTNIQKTSNQ